TLLSFVAGFSVYWTLWGGRFALCFLISIYIHEMGHVATLQRCGIPATAPTFIPGFGGVRPAETASSHSERRRSRRPSRSDLGLVCELSCPGNLCRNRQPSLCRGCANGVVAESLQLDSRMAAGRQSRDPIPQPGANLDARAPRRRHVDGG